MQNDVSDSRHPPDAAVVELDVRDDLRAGREPFQHIMSAVATLPAKAILHLKATFEPVPLFRVLEKRGFAHESRENGFEDWSAWFWKPGTEDVDIGHVVELDVRGLEPPDPLVRTLAALETLPVGHTLVHINSRVPQLLFPMLAERGFGCEVDDSQPTRVLVRIRHISPDHPSHTRHSTVPQPAVELDVRVIPPRDKHPTIFRTFDDLTKGQSMLIINDHDPRPLRYQLAAERPESFDWTYEAEGPNEWRVRIVRR
ncbi:MAG: DUF2249 domain-containing protein [Gemmatimonadaceae bacterium]|nr:DUF2249 domain-containing protein [Gemmatimonadaceae bacterium]